MTVTGSDPVTTVTVTGSDTVTTVTVAGSDTVTTVTVTGSPGPVCSHSLHATFLFLCVHQNINRT